MLKLVTVLFADVVGSTARAEASHPEDVRTVMTSYFEAMAEEIRAEGGTLEKFVGDAIMAVFGVPSAHEDDPVRAVRAARRMLERLRTWNATRDEQFAIRIGIETGDVVASGDAAGELLVTGDSVNVAARLQQVAEPGMIVVGERTARAVRSHFTLREAGEPLGLKGKSEPVKAWLVAGEREAVEERGVPGLTAPLVGRERELDYLRTELERVTADGRPALVTLLGDAGIGKSRLVRELLAQVDDDATVLIGRCLPSGQGAALLPLADMLEARAGVFDSDGAETALAKIAHLVEADVDADIAGDASRTAAALATTLNVAQDAGAPLDPRERRRDLVNAWRALFGSLARRAPIVAVVEDLHWADPQMLDILDDLADRLEGPILFVCTARPDLLRVRPDWGGGRRTFSSLPLDALSAGESALLVSLLLEIDSLADSTRDGILERSEGNPFFLEEIIRHLIDEGVLTFEDGRWRARQEVRRVDLPDSVQAVILARLDLLSPEEKRVAQRAAVIGRFFWDGAVAAVAGVDDLDAVLGTLRRREFVVERISSSIAAQREFVFKHVLIRDVAYESLPRRERGRAHVEAAGWLERTTRASDVSEQLAYHYESAYGYLGTDELRCKARARLLEAAANAHRRFATTQGERLGRSAVDLSRSGGERVEALEALADQHYHVGDAAWRAFSEALVELSEDDPNFPRLAGKAAQFGSRWVGTMAELPAIDEVRNLIAAGLRAAPPDSPERARLLVDEGFLVLQRERRPRDVVDRAVDEALAAADAAGDADIRSAALDLASARAMFGGRFGDMRRRARTRTQLLAELRDVKEIGDTYAMVAWSAHDVGLYREAEAGATACIERSREVDAGAYLHGLTWRVASRFMLGDWDGALADQSELERVASLDSRELPAGFTVRAYAYAALCHELRGEAAVADRYIDLTLATQARAPEDDPPPRGSLHLAPLARALAHRGRFDDALSIIPLEPHSGSAARTLEALCEIVPARADWAEAAAVAAKAREEAAWGELVGLPVFVDRLEGRAAAAAGDVELGTALLRGSADGFAQLEARWEEAFSRLLLAETLLERDAHAAQRELGQALAVFEQLHSVKEVDRARALLAAAPA
jgi:class 3 adenylate cyclase